MEAFMNKLFLLTFLPIALFSVEILDHDMSLQERTATGVYKLNDKEKATLQSWIDKHYVKRDTPLADKGEPRKALLSENLQNGKFIRLNDGTLWAIRPQDTPITQSWITPVDIIQSPTGSADYTTKLTNSLTGSSVMANQVKQAPAEQKK